MKDNVWRLGNTLGTVAEWIGTDLLTSVPAGTSLIPKSAMGTTELSAAFGARRF
jgi:hypothetical protein